MIILFKSVDGEPADDQYLNLLSTSSLNENVVLFPTLSFNYVNQTLLADKLEQVDAYDGIIFTSPRCVNAVIQCFDSIDRSIVTTWTRDKKAYVVGPKCCELIQQKLCWQPDNICQPGSSNAKSLGNLISSCLTRDAKSNLLYPCGNLRLSDLRDALEFQSVDVNLDEIIVYDTTPDPGIGQRLNDLKISASVVYAVFFSPSTVDYAWSKLKAECGRVVKVIPVAIGPTTAKKLQSIQPSAFEDVLVSARPSPEDLKTLLQRHIVHHSL